MDNNPVSNMSNRTHIFMAIAAISALALYAICVFLGYSVLFAIYQFLRDRGYDFWQSTGIMVLVSCLMAVPPLVARLYLRYQK